MIRNNTEYEEASKRLRDDFKRVENYRIRLKQAGLGQAEIKRVIDPLESFYFQQREEVEAYTRVKRGTP